MIQEPVEEGEVGDHFREEDGTIIAWSVYGPAMVDEKFEEGKLPVRGRVKDFVRSLADNGRANGKEIACDVGIARAKGGNKAVVQKVARPGWVLGGDDGLDGGKGAMLASGFETGSVSVVPVNDGVDVVKIDGEVIVGRSRSSRSRLHVLHRGLRRRTIAISTAVLRAGTQHSLLLYLTGSPLLQIPAARIFHNSQLKLLLI